MSLYLTPHILCGPAGNNAFAYEIRQDKTLYIPSIRIGSLSDLQIGNEIVFSEEEDGVLYNCVGLASFIRTSWEGIPMIIFDNHNHALYFWYEALSHSLIEKGVEIIHIDEHSDLWDNPNYIISNTLEYMWEFTNYKCNVANYIQPAIREGLVGRIIRIEGEDELHGYEDYTPPKNSILNLDLDFFSPDLDYIPYNAKKRIILSLAKNVKLITIATSPFFMDQSRALHVLSDLFR